MADPLFPSALVMLALDERDATVLAAIETIAERAGVRRVLVAHVYKREAFPAWMDAGTEAAAAPARPAGLDDALDRLKRALPGIDVVGVHAVGEPAEEVGRIIGQEDVDLLVIGRNVVGPGGDGWGPSGRKLLHSVACSALVVPVGSSVDLGHAVVGLDFSHNSADALCVAARLCDHTEALTQYDVDTFRAGVATSEAFQAEVRKNALDHFERSVLPRLGDVPRPALSVVPGGKASQIIVDHAGHRLVVVGSRGLTRLATLLLGSTAENIAGRSTGPALIVRRKGERLGLLDGLIHR